MIHPLQKRMQALVGIVRIRAHHPVPWITTEGYPLHLRQCAAAVLLFIGTAAPISATAPVQLVCATGQITWLKGTGVPRMPLLIWWRGRPVGGGSGDRAGHWALPLSVGNERPGIYAVEVWARGERTLVGAFECTVGGVPPVAQPTPNPLNTGGADRYNCADFAAWRDANAAFQANRPGDPNGLDTDGDGIPCENLPGAPAR